MRKTLAVLLFCSLAACGKKGGTTGDTGNTNDTTKSITYTGPQTRFIGRTQATSGGTLMAWSATAVETRFNGTQLSISVTNAADQQANRVALYIDGSVVQTFYVDDSQSPYKVSNLASGIHTAMLVKLTEAGAGQIIFGGFSTDGTLLNTQTPTGRLIEFVGDSISAGYGDEAINPSVCNESPPWPADPNYENGYKAYGPVTATAVNADWSVVAWSGKGVYENRNSADLTTIPMLFPLINPEDTTSTYNYSSKADVVVVDLGTNDFYSLSAGNTAVIPGSDQQPFTQAYTNLISTIRAAYPDAYIVVALGPMLSDYYPDIDNQMQLTLARSWLQSMVTQIQATDAKVSFTEFPVTPDQSYYGCDDHPDVAYQTTMAQGLVETIQNLTGWQ